MNHQLEVHPYRMTALRGKSEGHIIGSDLVLHDIRKWMRLV